ncbi:NYN domain-containing protein [Candidatus Poriferisocius sp.]|uniref:NYN domain-containing protein n=1 Tax=Candidatus Poriferisocius sp. TaxID=3101276 RepID=UPI003B515F2D
MRPGDSPTNEALREALKAVVEVAREGQKEKPPVDPPTRLKQLLTFKKFSERALDQVRQVVEDDEEFRERVVEAINEKKVGRVGWLWLARPDGWEKECAELSAAAEQESEMAADAQSHRVLEQRLRRAEAALEKAERQREKSGRDRNEARLESTQARAEARQSQEESIKLATELAKTRGDLDAIQKNLERIQRKESRTDDRLKKAQKEIERLNRELRDSRQQHEEEVGRLKERLAVAEVEVAAAREAGFTPPREPEHESPPPLTRRTPVTLPPGMLKDTVVATEHLLRTPKVVMLVDGYNVTFKSWQGFPVREQRMRLLQRLEEMSARYPEAEIVVVFDGTATDYDYISTTARSLGVTVRFSPAGIEADDVIIERCRDYPLWQPLVVVSHDSRVRESARKLGANLVQPSKLLVLMGVEMDDGDDFLGFAVR